MIADNIFVNHSLSVKVAKIPLYTVKLQESAEYCLLQWTGCQLAHREGRQPSAHSQLCLNYLLIHSV